MNYIYRLSETSTSTGNIFEAPVEDFAVHSNLEKTFEKIFDYFNGVAYEVMPLEERLQFIEYLLVAYTGKKCDIFAEYKSFDKEVSKKEALQLFAVHLIIYYSELINKTPKDTVILIYESISIDKQTAETLLTENYTLFAKETEKIKQLRSTIDNFLYNIKTTTTYKNNILLLIIYLIALDSFENFF